MDPLDAPNTSFMLKHDNYYYNVMPFSLKNIVATYQRLMDSVFSHQIGQNIKVYVDGMIEKTNEGNMHAKDLEDVLQSARKYNIRLNSAKCSFRVQAGKFIGLMLTKRCIEANPDKCQSDIDMRSPIIVKEMQ